MNKLLQYLLINRISIIFLVLLCSYGSAETFAQNAKRINQIDSMIKVARTSTVDSIVLFNYSYVSRRIRHLEYDTIKAILDEGIEYAQLRNINNQYTFNIKYADITTDFQILKSDSLINKIHKVLPLSYNLPASYRIRAYRHLGNLHKSKFRFDSAIYYYDLGNKTALKTNNTLDVIQLKSLLAITYLEAGNTEVASNMILKIDSTYPKAYKSFHYRRAFVYINTEKENYQEVIDFCLKIKKSRNDTFMVRNYPALAHHLPKALYSQGKIDEALEIANRYLKIQNSGIGKIGIYNYLQTIGKCHLDKGKPQEAIDALNLAASNTIKPGLSFLTESSKIKCQAYIQLGLKDSARYYLEKYVSFEKQDAINKAKVKYQQTLVAYQTKEIETKFELLAKKSEVDQNRFNSLLLIGSLLVLGITAGIFVYFKRRQEKSKRALVEAELTSIRSQMNPHFMFNALNSIKSYIIKEEPKLAAEYLSRFASLIRRILDLSSQKRITLKEELETLDLYVAMERVRFKNKFDYRIHSRIKVSSHETYVPPLFLQPFLENAIKHGLNPLQEKKGLLELIIDQKGKKLEFTVRDNGIGRQIKNSDHKSKGVSLSLQRMQLWNEGSSIKRHIEIIDLEDDDSFPIGTEVRIEIAIKTKEDKT